MSSGINFDEAAAKGLERIYRTPDVVAQRSRCLALLDPQPGERVLDVGVGPGLLAYDMAAIVGGSGHVAGIDLSEAMLEMSRARCAEQPWTEFKLADATELPFPDESFDALISTQVYEYVSDMKTALREAFRVLRPGGRILILDTDWDSFVCNSRDRERSRRILAAWDEHLHDPHLPATLAGKLRSAGFRMVAQEAIPILNTSYNPNTYSFGILFAIQSFAAGRRGVSQEEADAWGAEVRGLGESGEFFFSLNRYIAYAVKP